jgi:hypothetical protein
MITATFFKRYNDFFLYWSYSSKTEEKVLRTLLTKTHTIKKNGHYFTKINTTQARFNQTSIDYWLLSI